MAEGGFEMDDAAFDAALGAALDEADDAALDAALDEADDAAFDAALDEADDAEEETSFIDPVPIGAKRVVGYVSQQQKLLKESSDAYYDAMAKKGHIPLFRDSTNFVLVGSELRLKAYPDVQIIKIVKGKSRGPLALSTVSTHGGGAAIISGDGLGFVDWTYADSQKAPSQKAPSQKAPSQKAPRRNAPRQRLPSTIQAQFEKVADEADAAATSKEVVLPRNARMPVRVWACAPRIAQTYVLMLSFSRSTPGWVNPSDLSRINVFQACSVKDITSRLFCE